MRSFITLTLLAIMLTACGSDRYKITYSGREESTEGVPGFVKGKKVSPNIKLGQSYSIDGDTYVPRHQPDYVEEGMASWYGPGFHGKRTANGEEFDKHEMTAAHRTLPLPSIVKVTMLSTGKSAYVRVNDRGPYAHSRIIDLSYGAAKEIGMIAKGTGRVRVEYQLAESQRFADLLAQGRTPESINVEEEVLEYARQANSSAQVAAVDQAPVQYDEQKTGALDRLNPIASARANEDQSADIPYNVDGPIAVESKELGVPLVASAQPIAIVQTPYAPPPRSSRVTSKVGTASSGSPPIAAVPANAQSPPASIESPLYIQLGSFSRRENVAALQARVVSVGSVLVVPKSGGTQLLYRVRMGPYSASQANIKLAQLSALGLSGMALVKQ